MPPYEALYKRKYRSSIHWDEVGDRQVFKRVLEADDTGYADAFTAVSVPSFKAE